MGVTNHLLSGMILQVGESQHIVSPVWQTALFFWGNLSRKPEVSCSKIRKPSLRIFFSRLCTRQHSNVPWSKVAILGMVIQPLIGNPYNGYINPYYWVDDHPLLYGNNGSLDPGTNRRFMPRKYPPWNQQPKPLKMDKLGIRWSFLLGKTAHFQGLCWPVSFREGNTLLARFANLILIQGNPSCPPPTLPPPQE